MRVSLNDCHDSDRYLVPRVLKVAALVVGVWGVAEALPLAFELAI